MCVPICLYRQFIVDQPPLSYGSYQFNFYTYPEVWYKDIEVYNLGYETYCQEELN